MQRTEANMGIEPRKKAIIIGISQYSDKNIEPANVCERNGQEMYNTLISIGYEILYNHKLLGAVKYETMRDTISNFFINDVHPNDTLIFYYSGHGMIDQFGDVYLASSETKHEKPNIAGLSFKDLIDLINKSLSKE
jgi:Caspase domain